MRVARVALVVLLGVQLAAAQAGLLAELSVDTAIARPPAPLARGLEVADASSLLQLALSERGTGTVSASVRTAGATEKLAELVAIGDPPRTTTYSFHLEPGAYELVLDPTGFDGAASASVVDLTAAGALLPPGTLARRVHEERAPVRHTDFDLIRVPESGRAMELRLRAEGTGTVFVGLTSGTVSDGTYVLTAEGSGSVDRALRWTSVEGAYTFELGLYDFAGTVEAGLFDVAGAPYPEPYPPPTGPDPANLAYVNLGSEEAPTDFPTNVTARVADASHVLVLTSSSSGTGIVALRILDAQGRAVLERELSGLLAREEQLRLEAGVYTIELRPQDFRGNADAALYDATLAGWLGNAESLVYEGGTDDEPRTYTSQRVFIVPSGGRPLDFHRAASGSGTVAWRVFDPSRGNVVFEDRFDGTDVTRRDLWSPEAGSYVFETVFDGFRGSSEAGVRDTGAPPYPDPYARVPLYSASAPPAASSPASEGSSWPLLVGGAILAVALAGGGAVALRRRRPLAPRPAPSAPFASKYRVERELGSGAFGTTYLAHHLGLDRPVVIKRMRADRVANVDAFLREAKTLAAIDHPAVTRVFDVDTDADGAYIVMEYVDGGTLDDLLARGPVTRAAALRIVDDLLAALAAVHEKGIVHGDIKPSNVLLTREGRAKLADFGIARRAGAVDLGTTMVTPTSTGTPLYMAPEQVQGLPATPSADLYAVAIVAFRLLAGGYYLQPEPTAESELRNAILSRAPAPSGLAPGLDAWLRRALAKSPAERWSDAAAMRAALAVGLTPSS